MWSIYRLKLINFKIPFVYLSVSFHVWSYKMTSPFNLIHLTGENEREAVLIAAKCLAEGKIIALPTDTLYGLAVDATNSEAINSLYQAKQRDIQKPFAICVDRVNEIRKWGVVDDLPNGLLNKLLPGPVTVLLNRTSALSLNLNPGVVKVGIRVIPGSNNNSFASNIASVLDKPLALTSANPSNFPSCIDVHEFKSIWPLIGVIFDAGTIDNDSRDGSTIVDLSVKGEYKIVRSGIALKSITNTLDKYGLVEN